MANYNNPKGFEPSGTEGLARMTPYTVGAVAIKKGDVVAFSAGKIVLYDPAVQASPIGVAAEDAAIGAAIRVFDDPDETFVAQTSDAYTPATHDGTLCDHTGATGAQQIVLGTNTYHIFRILRRCTAYKGHDATGLYAYVYCQFALHALAGLQA